MALGRERPQPVDIRARTLPASGQEAERRGSDYTMSPLDLANLVLRSLPPLSASFMPTPGNRIRAGLNNTSLPVNRINLEKSKYLSSFKPSLYVCKMVCYAHMGP